MEKNLNHEESLMIISEMINRARNNVQNERTYSMIFWGYTIAVVALVNFVLFNTLENFYQSFLVWFAVIPAWGISYLIERRIDRTALVKTHIDKISDMIWKGFGIGTIVIMVSFFATSVLTKTFIFMMLTNPIIMCMIGICEFATAVVYRYNKWYWVAALFWTGAVICVFLNVDKQFIVLAVCMLCGFVIPGHLLNHQSKKNNV